MMSLGREVRAHRRPRIDLLFQKHIAVAVVIVVLVTLAVMAVPVFMDNGSHCRRSEPDLNLGRIARMVRSRFTATGAVPKGTSQLVPPWSCCPEACSVPAQAWAADPIWSALGFSIDTPFRAQYRYESDGITVRVTATFCGRTWVMNGGIESGEPRFEIMAPPPTAY